MRLSLSSLMRLRTSWSCKLAATFTNSRAKSSYTMNLPPNIKFFRTNPLAEELKLQKELGLGTLYQWQREHMTSENEFVLHDGPPYANGAPHIGHALNKILKDITARYQLMQGRRVHFRPGWDCHGLPIEIQVTRKMEKAQRKIQEVPPMEIRDKARKLALSFVDTQRNAMRSWCLMTDWENPYLTLSNEYVAAQLGVFSTLYEKGFVYRGLKPVHWSPSSRSSLADSELEYKDLPSPSVYIKFPLVASGTLPPTLEDVSLLVWTTTPWTLPANEGVCFNPSFSYVVVRATSGESCGQKFLVARTELETLPEEFECSVLHEVPASSLAGLHCGHPMDESRVVPLLPATHVRPGTGTGLVHTAPSHGSEDHAVGMRHSLPVVSLVNDGGFFEPEAGPRLAGKFVLSHGNKEVVALLKERGILVVENEFTHRYPVDWRTKKPVIMRPLVQWFINVGDLTKAALECLDSVKFIPESSAALLKATVSSRTDWCISRQRSWGVPIPVFYGKDSGKVLMTTESIRHVQSLVKEHGSDIWFTADTDQLIPRDLRSEVLGEEEVVRGMETMDVWLDSGSSWASVLPVDKDHQPEVADLYLEGVDQARGWFQSSLLTSVALHGRAPYKSVLTHGFVLDARNQKMSKSLGNTVAPEDIMKGNKALGITSLGVEGLRVWVALSKYQDNPHLDQFSVAQSAITRFRSVLRYMLQNLHGFRAEQRVALDDMLPLDRYMLHSLYHVATKYTDGFSKMAYSNAFMNLNSFMATVSSTYYDAIKDRLYSRMPLCHERLSALTVLHHYLDVVPRLIAPVMPITAEEVVHHYPDIAGAEKPASPFRCGWPVLDERWAVETEAVCDAALAVKVQGLSVPTMGELRADGRVARSKSADVAVFVDRPAALDSLRRLNGGRESSSLSHLTDILQCAVARVQLVPDVAGACPENKYASEAKAIAFKTREGDEVTAHVAVQCEPGKLSHCPRCWRSVADADDQLCRLCAEVEGALKAAATSSAS